MNCVALTDDLWVADDGRVFGPRGERKQYLGKVGYKVVNYRKSPKYVHRLVAEAFIENPDNKPVVAHWDGNKTNNHVSNLRWATQAENEADKIRHGTSNRGSRNPQAKLTPELVTAIRHYRSEGHSVDDLAAVYGVSKWTIYDACNPKRTWQYMPDEMKETE